MKITAILLLAAVLHVSARTNGQSITLSVKNAPLKKVLNEIEKQSGYNFVYTSDILERAKKVDLQVSNISLVEVLNICFQDQPLTYSIIEKTIVLKVSSPPKETNITTEPTINAIDVSGRVTDNEGNPLEGASVKVKGTTIGTTTNVDGVYVLKGIDDNAILVFSYAEHETVELKVGSRNNITVALKRIESNLQEVVINKGYYTEKQKYSVGNVGKVTAKEIEKQPVNNPLLALQGRVPGLFIEQSTGLPGAGVKVRIQGQNSLSRGSDPLYVIDGMPYFSQMLLGVSDVLGRSGGALTTDGASNPLNFINPNDIESIEVLKDADATAIYGSRAAAGAILITTKKGKAGKTKVEVNVQQGWAKVGKFLDVLNTQQYIEMRSEGLKNESIIISPNDGNYDVNGSWDRTKSTNWQKKLIGGTARYSDAQMTFSGGTSSTNFLIGGGYHKETTVFPGDFSDRKSSLHFNINHSSNDQKLKLQLDGKYMFDDNTLSGTDLTGNALKMPPNAPELFMPDGSLNWAPNITGTTSTWKNPLAYFHNKYRSKVNNLISNANIIYSIVSSIDIKINLGYTNLSRKETSIFPLLFNPPERRATSTRFTLFGNDQNISWVIEPQINYRKHIGKGICEALIGSTFLDNKVDQQQLNASGFSSDLLIEDVRSASSLTVDRSIANRYRYNALFARLNYNWQDRYIVNVTGRRDGSSRFGSKNLFNNFGSVGGAWIFSEEEFIKRKFSFLNYGKLRASFGTTGNDQIGDYQFMNLYYSINRTVPFQGVTGLSTFSLPNEHLQWEETNKLQTGIDLGLFTDRINFTATYFRNRSSNQLQSYTLPLLAGTEGININFPATIQNSGWEFGVNYNITNKKDFTVHAGINLTIPKNKLVSYENLDKSSNADYLVVGQPFTISRLYHYLGVDPGTGLFTFSDSGGNPTSNPSLPIDASVWINTSPKFYGGFQTGLRYKSLMLDLMMQFVKQVGSGYEYGNQPGRFFSTTTGFVLGNQPISVIDRWKKTGDMAHFQKVSSTYGFAVNRAYAAIFQSDANYQDASYIRLKNLSVSWQLPQRMLRRIKISDSKIFVHGQNLFTITKYSGLDPETRSISSLPPLKVWTFGIQIVL